jgi:hypothetical protein
MDALERLGDWSRKYYSFSIQSGQHMDTADGATVTLCGGKRKIEVCDHELVKEDEYGTESWPSLGELIHHALDQWHADTSVKTYDVLCGSSEIPSFSVTQQCTFKEWVKGETWMIRTYTTSEEDAKRRANDCFIEPPRLIGIWEK